LDSSAAGALSSWASSSSKGYQKVRFIQYTINIDRFSGRPGFTVSHVQRASQSFDGLKKRGAETNTNKNKNQWQRFFFDSIFYLILFFAFFVKFFFSSSFVVCGLNNY